MGRLTYDGDYEIVSSGFIAQGDSDQSEGRGGRIELGRFTTAEEAHEAVQGKGVQGDPGYIYSFELRLHEGGLTSEKMTLIFGRPSIEHAHGNYAVGWLNPDGSRKESA